MALRVTQGVLISCLPGPWVPLQGLTSPLSPPAAAGLPLQVRPARWPLLGRCLSACAGAGCLSVAPGSSCAVLGGARAHPRVCHPRRLLLIGDSGVGKSCLLLRFAVSGGMRAAGGPMTPLPAP